ncbi:sensor domain-containing protein [Sulfurimonas sp.]|uniref:sensor domain-containing protein n=1 Tax=Sulfurimonas sp. TaxID=2022749 RepID=UPI002B498A1F|nr:EAL domain-containing protein [Sulfurimonas sp.]
MPFKLTNLKEHNSELLNLLTQHLPDMFWVKDLEGIYLYANKAICDGLLMAKNINEPIGKGDVFFALRERNAHKDKPDWHTFGELCFNSDLDVIEQDKAMKFEEYGNVKGKLMYLEVYKAPFYDKDGKAIGTVGACRDITKLKKIQMDLEKSLRSLDEQREQLEYQANHDYLTDLPNRILFVDRLKQSISLADRYDKKIALLFIDLDYFKEINDSLGHHIGDMILVEFANRMKNEIRKSDTISRFGGDEFCIILNDISNVDFISNFITQCMKIVKKPFITNKQKFHISMSVGVAFYPNDGDTPNTLLKNADAAMYKAKDSGRSTYCFYDENMTKKALDRISLETELRSALENDELVVFFQPQMDVKINKLVGMEALVRWKHPTLGLVFPDKFIPLAELTGMIVELDRFVMKQAIRTFKGWDKAGLNPGKLSMNLAIKQLESGDFIEFMNSLLNSEDFYYHNLELEVTESEIMKNPDKSIEVLKTLDKMGISIAIDDFGTGYSSLAYLTKLPIKKLKIDKSFIDGIIDNQEDSVITIAVINLCISLNLKVIAEGVETKEQESFLLENGCKFVQGYLYSKPLSAKNMTNFLQERAKG